MRDSYLRLRPSTKAFRTAYALGGVVESAEEIRKDVMEIMCRFLHVLRNFSLGMVKIEFSLLLRQ